MPTPRPRTLALAAIGLAALLVGGCTTAPASRVTIFNESSVGVEAETWLTGQDAASGTGQFIAGGGEADLVLMHEGIEDPRVTVSISATGSETVPYMIDLTPPGPFYIRVRGNASGITVARTGDPAEFDDRRLPSDPRRRGFNDDLPPVNPSSVRP